MQERVWRKGNIPTLWEHSHYEKVVELPYDPGIQLLGIYPDTTIIQKDICTFMFIAALCTIPKPWKQLRCTLADE